MNEYLPLITVFLSGLFGLAVAIATSLLTNRKDTMRLRREAAYEAYEEMKSVYIDSLACLEKCLRCVSDSASFPSLKQELAVSSAKLQLIAPDSIIVQSHKVSDLMYTWSTEHHRGQPKPVGETGMALISSHDHPHQEKAKELYPQLMNACTDLTNLMRDHLSQLRENIRKLRN
jgi:hypothetical protein